MRTIALIFICSTFLFTACPEITEPDYGNPLLPAYTHQGKGSFGMMVNESDPWSTQFFAFGSPSPIYVNGRMAFNITQSLNYDDPNGDYSLEKLWVFVDTDSIHPGNLGAFEGVYGIGAGQHDVQLTVIKKGPNNDTLFYEVLNGTGRLEISQTSPAGNNEYNYSGTFGFDFPSTDVSPELNLHYGRFDFRGYY